MILNRRFDLLWFDADIPLCGACAAVLQQPLHKGYIEAVGSVDFRCGPIAEDGENQISAPDIERSA